VSTLEQRNTQLYWPLKMIFIELPSNQIVLGALIIKKNMQARIEGEIIKYCHHIQINILATPLKTSHLGFYG